MTEQLDYIFFFYGLGFILFASVCLVLGKNKQHSLPWTWLGLFGLVHGMNEWLDMLALSIGDSNPFKALRICIMAASFLCLVEFGRLGTKSITGKGSTKLAILALFVIGCTGWLFGWTGLNVFFRYSLGLVGGLWSARAFFLASRNSKKRNEIHILLALYAIFVTYSIASGLITPKAPFFPASLLNQDSFLQLFGFPVQLLRGMLAVASAVCVWQMLQSHRQFAKRLYVFVFTVSALGIIMGGWFSVNHTGESTRRNSLESLHSTCRLLAAFVDPKIAEDFSLINKAGSPTEVRMRARFIAMLKNNKQYRWIYLMSERDNKIIFTADSEPRTSKDYTPYGTVYSDAPDSLRELFAGKRQYAIDIYKDKWGEWVSAFVPIRNEANGRIVAVLGIDCSAKAFRSHIAHDRLEPIFITLLAMVLLIAFYVSYEMLRESVERISASEKSLAEKVKLAVFSANISRYLIQADETQKILQGCAEVMVTHLEIAFARIWILNEQENVLELQSSAGIYTHIDGLHSRIPVGQFKIGRIAQDRKAHLTNAVVGDPNFTDQGWAKNEGMVAFAGYPLLVDNHLLGVMAVFARRELSEGILETMETAANSIAMWIQRKQTEQTLRENEERFRYIIKHNPNAIAVYDKDLHYVLVSDRYMNDYGLGDQEIIGRHHYDVFPEIPKRWRDVHQRCLHGAVESAEEDSFIRIDGSVDYNRWECRPWRHSNGTIGGIITYTEVITKRKIAEEELRKTTVELEKRNRMVEYNERLIRQIVEHIPMSIGMFDKNMCYKVANNRWLESYGIGNRDIIGLSHYEVFPEIGEEWKAIHKHCLEGNVERCEEDPFPRADGGVDWIHWEVRPWYEVDGAIGGLIMYTDVITQKVEMRRAIELEHERLTITLNSIGDAVISTDAQRRVVRMNPVAEELTGWVLSEAIGRPISEVLNIINAITHEPAPIPVDEVLSTGEVCHLANHTTLIARDGTERQIADSAAPIRDNTGTITGVVLVFSDVTEQYRIREELSASKTRLHTLVQTIPDLIWLKDKEGVFLSCNTMFERFFGAKEADIVGKTDYDFVDQELADFYREHDLKAMAADKPTNNEEWITFSDDGHRAFLETIKMPMHNAQGMLIGVLGIGRDITERKQAEDALALAKAEADNLNCQLEKALFDSNQYALSLEIAKGEIEENAIELSHQATHDSLTRLPNRYYFEQHLSELITRKSAKKSRSLVVLFLDLDKFKMINDTLGHKVGDLLLIEVADRLQLCLRSEDILARMGGDEFTVILTRSNHRSIAESVASRMIDSISCPFEIQGHRFVIGASIGLASYPSDGADIVSLLKHADAAMYKAKQSGRGTFCWYSGDVDVENQQRADMEMDIRMALEKGQFSVHYQPIVSLEDENILAAEALLRWEHPDKGMISPSLFVPIAEEIGLIGEIGDFVLRTACAQIMAWRNEGIILSQIAVNASTKQVRDASWLNSVSTALADSGLDARFLNLEVTETDFASDYESMKETLRKAQELGICMAIDDFGMGQSSLSRLKDFPVIHLKIDGSFVRNIEHNKSDKALVRSIIEMAHSQGIKVTAEWVETEAQIEILRSIGCNFAQGYFISPALPAEAFGDFVRKCKWSTQIDYAA